MTEPAENTSRRDTRPATGSGSRHGRALAIFSVALMLWVTGCSIGGGDSGSAPSSGAPVASVPGAVPRPDHVLVVIFENKNYDQVIASPDAPYLTALARDGANLLDAHGETHP